MRLAARRRERLDGLPLLIATQEVHPRVRPGRVALQNLLDQAHRLEILAPVERGAETQTVDGVGDGNLRGGLPLVFAANRCFRGRLLRRKMLLDGRPDGRQPQTVLAHAMQELDDVRDAEC